MGGGGWRGEATYMMMGQGIRIVYILRHSVVKIVIFFPKDCILKDYILLRTKRVTSMLPCFKMDAVSSRLHTHVVLNTSVVMRHQCLYTLYDRSRCNNYSPMLYIKSNCIRSN